MNKWDGFTTVGSAEERSRGPRRSGLKDHLVVLVGMPILGAAAGCALFVYVTLSSRTAQETNDRRARRQGMPYDTDREAMYGRMTIWGVGGAAAAGIWAAGMTVGAMARERREYASWRSKQESGE